MAVQSVPKDPSKIWMENHIVEFVQKEEKLLQKELLMRQVATVIKSASSIITIFTAIQKTAFEILFIPSFFIE